MKKRTALRTPAAQSNCVMREANGVAPRLRCARMNRGLSAGLARDGRTASSTAAVSTSVGTAPTTVAGSDDASGKPCKAEQPTPAVKGQPAVPVPLGPPPTKLVTKDLKVGTGPAVALNDSVTMQYVLVACSTGQMVQSSWSTSPFTAQLSEGRLIEGWIQGIPGMKVGGRRLLVVPPSLGYGAQGNQGIAPNETLIFVVDLLKIG